MINEIDFQFKNVIECILVVLYNVFSQYWILKGLFWG